MISSKPIRFVLLKPCFLVWVVFALVFPFSLGAKEAQITILFTNDHHGQVEPLHESGTCL